MDCKHIICILSITESVKDKASEVVLVDCIIYTKVLSINRSTVFTVERSMYYLNGNNSIMLLD